ncbi:hypothetical protein ACFL1H_00280 [Nanoarchaeota archaeon]
MINTKSVYNFVHFIGDIYNSLTRVIRKYSIGHIDVKSEFIDELGNIKEKIDEQNNSLEKRLNMWARGGKIMDDEASKYNFKNVYSCLPFFNAISNFVNEIYEQSVNTYEELSNQIENNNTLNAMFIQQFPIGLNFLLDETKKVVNNYDLSNIDFKQKSDIIYLKLIESLVQGKPIEGYA